MINTFDLVMIPRITKMCIQQSHSLTKTLANNMNIQLILTIPMVFGLIAIMPSFYLWFFGEEFASTVPLMTILAILVLIIPLNMLISRQYLLIVNKIRLYNASITIGAVNEFSIMSCFDIFLWNLRCCYCAFNYRVFLAHLAIY